MPPYILFHTYVHRLMTERKVSADHLQHELNYRTSLYVQSWLDGHSRPDLCELPALANVLKADLVEMIAGWVICQMPELEEMLWTEVLQPRGSAFPHSNDLDLRAPRPKKRVTL